MLYIVDHGWALEWMVRGLELTDNSGEPPDRPWVRYFPLISPVLPYAKHRDREDYLFSFGHVPKTTRALNQLGHKSCEHESLDGVLLTLPVFDRERFGAAIVTSAWSTDPSTVVWRIHPLPAVTTGDGWSLLANRRQTWLTDPSDDMPEWFGGSRSSLRIDMRLEGTQPPFCRNNPTLTIVVKLDVVVYIDGERHTYRIDNIASIDLTRYVHEGRNRFVPRQGYNADCKYQLYHNEEKVGESWLPLPAFRYIGQRDGLKYTDLRYTDRQTLIQLFQGIENEIKPVLSCAEQGYITTPGTDVDPTLRRLTISDNAVLEDVLQTALQDYNLVDTSTVLYARDIGELPALAKQISSFVPQLLKGSSGVPKAIASAYLAFKYGVETFISDTEVLRENLPGAASQVGSEIVKLRASSRFNLTGCRHSGKSFTVAEQHRLTLYRQRNDDIYRSLLDALYGSGNPPTKVIWDAIPFSFVVDWFIHADEYAQYLDDSELLYRSTFASALGTQELFVTDPQRVRISLTLKNGRGVVFEGTLTYSIYNRVVLPSLPSLRFNPPERPDLTHWVEGLALIVQNTGRRRSK